jgi:DNA repair protein RAD5
MFEKLEFSPLEKKIYDQIYHNAKVKFDRLNAKGLVSKNYTHILAMLMRSVGFTFREFHSCLLVAHSLRRAVLHPDLVLTDDDERAVSPDGDGIITVNDMVQRFTEAENAGDEGKNAFAEEVLSNLNGEQNEECPICLDIMQTPMIIPGCMHHRLVNETRTSRYHLREA